MKGLVLLLIVAAASFSAYSGVVEIVREDVDESGRSSAYVSHSFSIEQAESGSIENAQWEYHLPLKNGSDTLINSSNDAAAFDIPAIDDKNKYAIDEGGIINGIVSFKGTLNGETIEDEFPIGLELKPYIIRAEITQIVDNAPYDSYDAYYVVEYRGANSITVSFEIEYGTKVPTWIIDTPLKACGVVDHIASTVYAWIDFDTENEYGKVRTTIELGPDGVVLGTSGIPELTEGGESQDYEYIKVYNLSGVNIATWQEEEFGTLEQGVYILKYFDSDNRCIKTRKYLKR